MTATLHPEPRHQEPNQTRRGLLKMLAAGTAAAFIPSSHGVLMPVRKVITPPRIHSAAVYGINLEIQTCWLRVTRNVTGQEWHGFLQCEAGQARLTGYSGD